MEVENAVEADHKVGETNCSKENDESEVDERMVEEQVVHEHTANVEKQTKDNIAGASEELSCENIIPTVVTIHATAVIDNSPNAALMNEDISSLAKILGNTDHLAKNIANFEYSYFVLTLC